MFEQARLLAYLLVLSTTAVGCSQRDARARVARVDRSDLPLEKANDDELTRFAEGDALFEATLREADGLGPLFIRPSCTACHRSDGRGPGLVGKMAVVEDDQVTPARDQSALALGPVERPYVTAGATRALMKPENAEHVRVTYRFPPAVFGRGYMEAVADDAIEDVARMQSRGEHGIHGRVHRVHCESDPQRRCIGRFGLKARLATLEEFTADAFQGDMGITSPTRPIELPNPDGQSDDAKPGVDISADIVHAVSAYVRLLEIPSRAEPSARGRAIFDQTLCSACHVPSLRTRADFSVNALARTFAPVFTDFLLHDMGPALGDGVVDEDAGSREWRTAPLIGLRFFGAYLHDGRAKTIEQAIDAHGGEGSEARESARRVKALDAKDRAELLAFVAAL